MLTDRLPFEGETPLSVAVKQKSEPPPDPRKLNPQIPEDLGRIILKCLEKSREKRYRSTEEILADLARVEQSLPTKDKNFLFLRRGEFPPLALNSPSYP
ncbi:MAG: hypothetical protein IMZ61_02950 [Planctomycetes bacterium]|nr:hypothetical protein [Planctomycetota bacterium]